MRDLDLLAMAAMQGLLSSPLHQSFAHHVCLPPKQLAEDAYEIAVAMVAEGNRIQSEKDNAPMTTVPDLSVKALNDYHYSGYHVCEACGERPVYGFVGLFIVCRSCFETPELTVDEIAKRPRRNTEPRTR